MAKKSRKTMSRLNDEVFRGEDQARTALKRFEKVMVKAGYNKVGFYRHHTGSKRKFRTVTWDGNAIYVGGGEKKRYVDDMTGYDLVFVASNIPYLLDALEDGNRWLLAELGKANLRLREFIKQVEAER